MDETNKKNHIKCNECAELITFNRTEQSGKCLRDSMYKDLATGQCQFGKTKNKQS